MPRTRDSTLVQSEKLYFTNCSAVICPTWASYPPNTPSLFAVQLLQPSEWLVALIVTLRCNTRANIVLAGSRCNNATQKKNMQTPNLMYTRPFYQINHQISWKSLSVMDRCTTACVAVLLCCKLFFYFHIFISCAFMRLQIEVNWRH